MYLNLPITYATNYLNILKFPHPSCRGYCVGCAGWGIFRGRRIIFSRRLILRFHWL